MPVSRVAQRPPRPPVNKGKAPARQETYGEGPSAPRAVRVRQEMAGEGTSSPRIDPHDGMAGIFKNIQGLYGLTTKKVAEEILAGASTTDSEATPSQNIMVVPLQEIRGEGVGASQPLEARTNKACLPPRADIKIGVATTIEEKNIVISLREQ
ncbi:hypothetical protein Dimus_013662 [Dionaea muscipula]